MVSPEGFKTATLRHGGRVQTCAAWMLGDVEEARDVTQEALLRLWTHHADVAPEAARSWLLRTTRRLCIDRLRRAARDPRDPIDPAVLLTADGGASRLIRIEEHAALARAVAALSFRDRATILLREVQGLSYEELGEVLEMPLGSVKAALHRARHALRAAVLMHEVTT